jgi:hypothetical protein
VVACGTFWVKARRPFIVQGFSVRELPEAKFEGKYSDPIVGMEGSGEGFPIHRYDHVVGPAKAPPHILFEETKPVLATYSGP